MRIRKYIHTVFNLPIYLPFGGSLFLSCGFKLLSGLISFLSVWRTSFGILYKAYLLAIISLKLVCLGMFHFCIFQNNRLAQYRPFLQHFKYVLLWPSGLPLFMSQKSTLNCTIDKLCMMSLFSLMQLSRSSLVFVFCTLIRMSLDIDICVYHIWVSLNFLDL